MTRVRKYRISKDSMIPGVPGFSRFTRISGFPLLLLLLSCQREPPLHLVDRQKEVPIEFETTDVRLDLEALWDYQLDYEVTYDWQAEWHYGWDEVDNSIFGIWDIQDPHAYHVCRYYTKMDPAAPHTAVLKDYTPTKRYRAKYHLGYYDFIVWNDVLTLDGVQSLHIDYESVLEYVTAYTNQSNSHTGAPQHAPSYNQPFRQGYAFYQPEFLFAGDYDDLYVSDDPKDYDYFDPDTRTWIKRVPVILTPVTYIYLTQVVLHNNRGRVAGIDGSGNLTGMARSVNMKTHITDRQDISVNYPMRFKQHIPFVAEDMSRDPDTDIVGGRVFTFGLTGINPYGVTRRADSYHNIAQSKVPNYLEVNMIFNNGMDSTFVFDVTPQVRKHYKGGVITVELDVDTIPIPTRSGGSGFDAVVKDFEEVTIPEIEL